MEIIIKSKRIDIGDIWYTQRHVSKNKVENLSREASHIRSKIILNEADDGEIELIDGHHRLTALWKSGRTHLTFGEYVLVCNGQSKVRFGQVKNEGK